jgi:hypothetical protein
VPNAGVDALHISVAASHGMDYLLTWNCEHIAETEFNLPIYLEPEIAEFVKKLAVEKNLDQSHIVNMLLKKDKEIIEI